VTENQEHLLLQAPAYHEAGHAVVSVLVGLRFTRVSIIPPDEESLGIVEYPPPPEWYYYDSGSPEVDRWLKLHILCNFGGELAAKKHTGEENPVGASQDRSQSNELALRLCGDDARATEHVADAEKETRLLLDKNWVLVETVANALLKHQELTESEVKLICEAAV
jgi:ATP-dependent Zn protease